MNDGPGIETTNLTRSFGGTRVVDALDLRVERGSVFALLGPNGAGKTTTVRILATLLRPDAGRASVAGHDVVRQRHLVRRSISLTGQYAAVDDAQTGAENLRMVCRLTGLGPRQARQRTRELLDAFDLAGAGDRRVATYSGGMRRRLDLAAGLVGRPAVIFLDEPTTGLDPRSRQVTWEIIRQVAATGVTVFLTTQYLEEADRLADRIGVIDTGRLVAEGTSAELKQRVGRQRLDMTLVDGTAYRRAATALGARLVGRDPDRLLLSAGTDGDAAQVRALLDEIDPHRTDVARFAVHTPTLDDVFLTLTGHTTATPDTGSGPGGGTVPGAGSGTGRTATTAGARGGRSGRHEGDGRG